MSLGGASTGGSSLIAVMLRRLRMSEADCIKAYLSLSDRVFCKTSLDAEELGRAVQDLVVKQGQRNRCLKMSLLLGLKCMLRDTYKSLYAKSRRCVGDELNKRDDEILRA